MDTLKLAALVVFVIAFVALMIQGLRGAWEAEQAYKAREASYHAAHPTGRFWWLSVLSGVGAIVT